MRLSGFLALLPALLLWLCCEPERESPAPFHIGICTETVAQGEDTLRGAQEMIREYGSVDQGGMIRHITYPDDFMSQQETLITNLVSLADDRKMKVIVACDGLPGVTEAFRRIRAWRPDILLLVALPHEDPLVVQNAADLVIDTDSISRGYTIPWVARELGAKTLVHISFPRHMSYEILARRRAIMEQACKDLGLRFVFQTAPDPTSDVGVAGAQQFILEKTPQWLRQYGPSGEKVCLFSTNDAQTEPLIKQIVASRNGVFAEPDSPSPLQGFPGALGLDLSAERGDFPSILKSIDKAMDAKGAGGRLGTWPFSSTYTFTAGLAELGKRVVEGRARLTSIQDVFAAMGKYTPGARWSGSSYVDLGTGIRARNQFMLYMDTYVFGRGYMGTTGLAIPAKYRQIR